MKRPLAYITAAWCGIPEVDTDLAVEFCRAAYEAGLAPICPKLYLPLILNDRYAQTLPYAPCLRRDCGRGREK